MEETDTDDLSTMSDDVVLFHSDVYLEEDHDDHDPGTDAFGAAAAGDLEFVQSLDVGDALLHKDDADKRTMLHLAAAAGNMSVVDVLIEKGASIDRVDRWGGPPLHAAITNGHREIADKLQTSGAVVPVRELASTANLLAAENNLEGLRRYHTGGGEFDMADYEGRTPLHLAAVEGHVEVVKWLLEHNVDVNVVDRSAMTALDIAVEAGHREIAQLLRKSGGQAEQPPLRPSMQTNELCIAAYEGNKDLCKKLVGDNVDVNVRGYNKRTPLHLAASEGHLGVVKYLLSVEADPEVHDRWGRTAYQDALRYGYNEIAYELNRDGQVFAEIPELDCPNSFVDPDECCKRFGANRQIVHPLLDQALTFLCVEGLACPANDEDKGVPWDYGEFWTLRSDVLCMEPCSHVQHITATPSPVPALKDAEGKRVVYSSLQKFAKATAHLLVEAPGLFFDGVVLSKGQHTWEDLRGVSQVRFVRAPAAAIAGLQTVLAVPVMLKGCVLGVVAMFSRCAWEEELATATRAKQALSLVAELIAAKVKLEGKENTAAKAAYCNALNGILTCDIAGMLGLVVDNAMLDSVFTWAKSSLSEDHRIVVHVLSNLVGRAEALSEDDRCSEIMDRVKSALMYLTTTSPRNSPKTPVRKTAEDAVMRLKTLKLWGPTKPYFSPSSGRISPIFFNLQSTLRETLSQRFDAFGRRGAVVSAARPVDAPALQGSDVYNSFGRENKDETSRVCRRANALLSSGRPLVTVQNLLDLHGEIQLQSSMRRGTLRATLAVGSCQHYRTYRVFCPHEEVGSALAFLVKDVARAQDQGENAVLVAYYTFTALVHYIHPFQDGNGRCSRLFGNMLLVEGGYPPVFQHSDKIPTFEDILKRVLKFSKMKK